MPAIPTELMAALTVTRFAPAAKVTLLVLITMYEFALIVAFATEPVIVGILDCHPVFPTNCHVLSYAL